MAEAVRHQVSGSNKSFIVSALITANHNDKRVQKPLESRYWSAVTQNILKAAELKYRKGWHEEAGGRLVRRCVDERAPRQW